MRHLSLWLHPAAHNLRPFQVTISRPESAQVPSMRAEGLRYTHPPCRETLIVWAQDRVDIGTVLTYHYRHDYTVETVSEPQEQGA
jgi:hypothetical protein